MLATLAQNTSTFWMPEAHSTYAADVDWLFYFLLYLSTFFTLLIAGLIVFFAITRHDGGTPRNAAEGPTHNTVLEVTWTGIPVILVLIIFFYGYQSYLAIAEAPSNPYEVRVLARTWSWSFQYPNKTDNALHVPADTPILLTLDSQDVIHSFFVPAFRVKRDVVPGRYNQVWFQVPWNENAEHMEELGEGADRTKVMVFDLFCAEYCGQQHSSMITKVYVYPRNAFDRWVESAAWDENTPPAQIGEALVGMNGCLACHTIGDAPGTAPSFKNLYGKQETFTTGETATVDADYIRESIARPQAKIVRGFERTIMSPYTFSDEEHLAIVEYLKSISDAHDEPLLERMPGAEATDDAAAPAAPEAQPAADDAESMS